MWAACGRSGKASIPLPETVAGGWQRTAERDLPPGSAPEPPARNTVRRVTEADYSGPGRVRVRVFELSSSGAALDAVQRFRPAADTVCFYRNAWFAVVSWQEPTERGALGGFVRALEKHLAALK